MAGLWLVYAGFMAGFIGWMAGCIGFNHFEATIRMRAKRKSVYCAQLQLKPNHPDFFTSSTCTRLGAFFHGAFVIFDATFNGLV